MTVKVPSSEHSATDAKPQVSWVVYPALCLASSIYGLWSLVSKMSLSQHGVNPAIMAFYRCIGGTIVMLIVHVLFFRSPTCSGLPIVMREHIPLFLLTGILTACNVCGNALALEYLPALTVSVFQPTLPIFCGIIAMSMGIERLSKYQLLSILITTCGAIVVIALKNSHAHDNKTSNYPVGILCLLFNVIGSAMCVCIQKILFERGYPPVFTMALAFGGAVVPIFIYAACTVGFPRLEWTMGEGNSHAMMGLAYAIFLTTTLNYSLTAWANKVTTPTTVLTFMSMQPIAAVIVSWCFLHQPPNMGQLVGGIIVIVGLLSFVQAKRQLDPEETPLVSKSKDIEAESDQVPEGRAH